MEPFLNVKLPLTLTLGLNTALCGQCWIICKNESTRSSMQLLIVTIQLCEMMWRDIHNNHGEIGLHSGINPFIPFKPM